MASQGNKGSKRNVSYNTPQSPRRRYAATGKAKRELKKKERRRSWRRFFGFKAIGLYILGFGLLGVLGIGIAYTSTEIPDPNEEVLHESTIVYWSDGKTELGRFEAQKRIPVRLDDIPQQLQDAVVAAEDRSFYENAGFDPVGIARAGVNFLRGGGEISGGGSGITQQYVKNYYLTQEQTAARKAEEIFIAVKLDQELSKDVILEGYLNTIWWGGQVYGVESAAQAYFRKSANELNLSQSVALAALIRNPGIYDPRISEDNKERFAARFEYVLDGMVATDALTEAEAAKVKQPKFKKKLNDNSFKGPDGYLMQAVKEELTKGEDAPLTEAELSTKGLRIVTTFDKKKQKAAVEAVKNEGPQDVENIHVGLAAIVPGDGRVVAMYGGPDAVRQSLNDAVDAKRQPGSAFKPFALAAGLEQGISLDSRFSGESPFEHPELGEKGINNYDDASGEPTDFGKYVDLVTATEKSINTAFLDLVFTMGEQRVDEEGAKKPGVAGTELVADIARRAGVPDPEPDPKKGLAESISDAVRDKGLAGPGPQLAIGTRGVPVIDMADAYATFAAGGQQADWYTVQSVTDGGGNIVYEGKSTVKTAFASDVAADVTYALQQVVESGTGAGAQEVGRPSAGKTGTHEELTAWFTGFVPQLSTAVEIFCEDYNAKTKGELEIKTECNNGEHMAGGSYPMDIWVAFMKAALEGEDVKEFPEPGDVGEPMNTPTPTPTNEPTDEPTDPEDEEVVVPGLTGLSQADAEALLESSGLDVGRVTEQESSDASPGVVLSSDPGEGTPVPPGTRVNLVVAREPPPQDLNKVPDVVGDPEGQAQAEIYAAGFEPVVEDAPTCDIEPGIVTSQDPIGGDRREPGAQVTLFVSREVDGGCQGGGNDNGGEEPPLPGNGL